MLLNGGQLNGKRLLGPRTVELMASNHVGTLFGGQLGRPLHGVGFGLSVEVVEDAVQADWRRSNEQLRFRDGAFGTIFWVDPKEQLIAVLMVQRSGGRFITILRTRSCRRLSSRGRSASSTLYVLRLLVQHLSHLLDEGKRRVWLLKEGDLFVQESMPDHGVVRVSTGEKHLHLRETEPQASASSGPPIPGITTSVNSKSIPPDAC